MASGECIHISIIMAHPRVYSLLVSLGLPESGRKAAAHEVYVYVYTHMYIYIYIYIYMHVCMCVYIYIYMYSPSYTFSFNIYY